MKVRPAPILLLIVCSASSYGMAQHAPDRHRPLLPAGKPNAPHEQDQSSDVANPPTSNRGTEKAPAQKPRAAITPRPTPGASWQAQDFYVEVLPQQGAKPLLVIHYPWQVHWRPSVEVRQLADHEQDTPAVNPLRFRAEIMKAEVTAAVYQCRDQSAETPYKRKLRHGDAEYLIAGTKNRLGRGSVYVLFPPKAGSQDLSARLVYPLLDCWAMDPRTLMLELPESYFVRPGRIRVWFLREGTVLWWKTVIWPGQPP